MSWREERRADRVVDAQIKREQAAAAAQVRITERAAAARQRRAEADAAAARARQARDERAARWRARWAGVRAWLAGQVVELLIYPVALLSFVLAAPAMAAWGHDVYGTGLGVLLPGITELGMWAFAIAVVVSRHRHPERPVGWLQAGVALFAVINFASNFLHGLEARWDHGVVMGLVAVAGVLAHQLTLATPLRSRRERAAARIERAAARKLARVQRVAVRTAVAGIDPDGTACLVYAPGRYRLTRRGRLVPVVDAPARAESTDWDDELADLLDTTDPAPEVDAGADATGTTGADVEGEDTPDGGGGVAALDEGPDVHESTPTPAKKPRARIDRTPGRTLDELKAEFRAAIEAGRVNPDSAESIRKALHCAPKYARQLRDDHKKGDTP